MKSVFLFSFSVYYVLHTTIINQYNVRFADDHRSSLDNNTKISNIINYQISIEKRKKE